MSMSERDEDILRRILGYCGDIQEAVERFGDSFDAFSKDKEYRNASVWQYKC